MNESNFLQKCSNCYFEENFNRKNKINKTPFKLPFSPNKITNKRKKKRMQHTHTIYYPCYKKIQQHAKLYCNKLPKNNNDKKSIIIILMKLKHMIEGLKYANAKK